MNRRERQERFEGLRRIGCIACVIEDRGLWCGEPEIHHLNEGSQQGAARRGDDFTIVLGRWHHRAVVRPGFRIESMTKTFGPSWATDKEQFQFAYGSDDHMLALCNYKLNQLMPATA